MPQQLRQNLSDMIEQLKTRWLGLARGTQIRFATAALVIIAALIITVFILTRPDMVMLQPNMDPQQLNIAVNTLSNNGIKYQIGNNTTSLSVQSKDLDTARLLLMNDPQLRSARTGFTYEDALDVGMGTTESTKATMERLARETAIEESILLLYDVNDAQVLINTPDTGPFMIREQDMPSASVILDLSTELTRGQIDAIAFHVSKSVHNLTLENVSIMDTNGRSLYRQDADGIGGSLSTQQEYELTKKNEIENQVRALLSPQFSTVDVMANIRWNWSGSQTEQVTYSAPIEGATGGMPVKEIIEESEVSNTEPAAEPGMMANNAEVPQYPVGEGASSEATRRMSDTDYALNELRVVTNSPAGIILYDDSSMAIRVYQIRRYTEDAAREAGELDEISWSDYQTNIRSNPVPVVIPEQTLGLIRTATGIENIAIEGYELPTFVDTEQIIRPINQLLMAGVLLLLIALLAFGLIRRTQPEVITEIEPDLSVEELLVSSTAQEPEEPVAEIDYFADSELKKQIDKFIDEKPEAAAQLLRNWLTEDWD